MTISLLSKISKHWEELVTSHYDKYPYPFYPLLASAPLHDTFAINLQAVWGAFNNRCLDPETGTVLLAGCGAFAPYPFGVANPKAAIDAVDLSESNIARAKKHCLLHGVRNVRFKKGNFLEPSSLSKKYHFIDAFGVLHHLENPIDGFRTLSSMLLPGGILRVMVYGRYARFEAESIRHAARILKIKDAITLKRILDRSKKGSRVREYLDSSWEAKHLTGIADLFLHPFVHTYRMNEFIQTVEDAGLEPLLFTHSEALKKPEEEIERFKKLDSYKESRTNIICYLGRRGEHPKGSDIGSCYLLNPSLNKAISHLNLKNVTPMNRLGSPSPLIDSSLKRFLRSFKDKIPSHSLSEKELEQAESLAACWYLIKFSDTPKEKLNVRKDI